MIFGTTAFVIGLVVASIIAIIIDVDSFAGGLFDRSSV